MLSKQDYPLPKAFDYAFSESDAIVFETDIDAASSPEVLAKFLPILMLQDGSTLESNLNQASYLELQDFLLDRGMDITAFRAFSPAGVSLTLTVLEMQRLGITEEHGVENYFNRLAKEQSKSTFALESIDQQIKYLSSLNDLDADMLVGSTIRDTIALKDEWQQMLQAWKTGDIQALDELFLSRMVEETPDLYNTILVERNQNWVSAIDSYIASPEMEFVLVGALHLAGKHSLLNMLKSQGYQVTQLK